MNETLKNKQTSENLLYTSILSPNEPVEGVSQRDGLGKPLQGTKAGPKDEEFKKPVTVNQKMLEEISMVVNLSKRLEREENMGKIEEVHYYNRKSVFAIQLELSDLEERSKGNTTQVVSLQGTLNVQAESAENKLDNIDGDFEDLNETVAVFEERYAQTTKKIPKVTFLTSNIPG